MATYDYYDVVGELISKKIIPNGDEYDFEISPTALTYSRYFQFCQENLSERCDEYNIQPARFYFRENFDVNARAGLVNGYYIIAVNKGTVHNLYEFFYNQNNIFETEELSDFNILNTILDVPIGYFMYQAATMFTYYHELGHLIQKSQSLNLWINEQYDFVEDQFDFLKHLLEFDADMHAANSLCFHPIDLWEKLNDEQRSQQNLEKILSLTLASIFSYFLFLTKRRNEPIYYQKYTHPHPLIRVTYILAAFLDVAKIYFPEVSQTNIMNDAFRVVTKLFKSSMEDDIMHEYRDTLFREYHDIMGYIDIIIEQARNVPYLATNTVHRK